MILEKWMIFHNTVVGWVFDHPHFPNGTHIQTGTIRQTEQGQLMFDLISREVHCVDGMYRLGEPGSVSEHDGPGYLGDYWKPPLIKRASKLLRLV